MKETYLNLMGQQVDPLNVAALSDGIYFKMSGGEKMRMFLKGGQWINPLAQAEEGNETEEVEGTIYDDHDKAYDYKVINGQWQTRRKGSEGDWIDLSTNEAATTKLNTAYPDAMTVVDDANANTNTTDVIDQDDLNSIVDDSGGQDQGLQLNKDNLKFISPQEGNLLSPMGDTNFIDLIKAVDTSVKSFKKENYYDPGSKMDYTKFSHTNTTDEDLYIDPEALAKGKKTGDVLKDAEQMTEIEMQKYFDERHKNNPQMFDKVKNFDADLYEQTGHIDRRRGLFNRKVKEGDFKEGDYLENKYGDASHIGFSVDKMGKYTKGFDYLTANEDGETFDQQSFDGFQNPNSGGDDSREYERSDKHNDDYNFANETSFESYKNAGINHNMNLEDDDPFGYTKIPTVGPLTPIQPQLINTNTPEPELQLADPTELYLDNIEEELRRSQGPLDQTDPQAVINANDQISLDEANQRYMNNLDGLVPRAIPVGPREDGRGLRYGGDLPKAQFSLPDQPIIPTDNTYVHMDNIYDTDIDNSYRAPSFMNKMTYGLFGDAGNPDGETSYNPELGQIAEYTDEQRPKVIGGSMPFLGTGVQLAGKAAEGIYDYFSPEGGTFGDLMGWSNKQYGGSLPQAQGGVETDTMKAFRLNATAWDLSGRCYNDGCAKRYYDSPHDLSVGIGTGIGKKGEDYMGDATLWGGYSFNPQPGSGSFRGAQEGLAGYLGANIGGRMIMPKEVIQDGVGDADFETFANAVGTLGYKGEWKPNNDYTAFLTGRDKNPLQYGLGAFYKHPLMGGNPEIGGYANLGNLNFTAGYTPGQGMNYGLGLGLPIRKQGGSLKKMQFAGSPDATGYNPLTNQFTPMEFNTGLQASPLSMNMFEGQSVPQEKTEPFFNTQDRMYAINQSVNRSMDNFDAFTADMNKRMENPSLQMNQVDTNPLNLPEFKIDEDLSNQIQMNSDMMTHRTARNDGRVMHDGSIIKTPEEIKESTDETIAQLEETVDNSPKYQGTKENLKRFDRSNELGFDGDLVAMDEYDQNEEEESIKRGLREDQLNKDNKDANPSFGDKLWNLKNRALDSKVGQTYQKFGAAAVNIAKPLNRILEQKEEREAYKNQMNNAYLSDNMFASVDADLSGSKGDYDVNSGIFRAEDKITTRQGKYGTEISNYLTFAKNGGSFFNDGGEAEIDINMYKELIAAGADIEII